MSLRNRHAVAAWLLDGYGADDPHVAVVCSGERWPDGTLRPVVEDLPGRARRRRRGVAGMCERAWADRRRFPDDVEIAAELDRSASVPVVRDGAFRV